MKNDTQKSQSLVSLLRQDHSSYIIGDIILISDVLVETANGESSCLEDAQVELPCKHCWDFDILICNVYTYTPIHMNTI